METVIGRLGVCTLVLVDSSFFGGSTRSRFSGWTSENLIYLRLTKFGDSDSNKTMYRNNTSIVNKVLNDTPGSSWGDGMGVVRTV